MELALVKTAVGVNLVRLKCPVKSVPDSASAVVFLMKIIVQFPYVDVAQVTIQRLPKIQSQIVKNALVYQKQVVLKDLHGRWTAIPAHALVAKLFAPLRAVLQKGALQSSVLVVIATRNKWLGLIFLDVLSAYVRNVLKLTAQYLAHPISN